MADTQKGGGGAGWPISRRTALGALASLTVPLVVEYFREVGKSYIVEEGRRGVEGFVNSQIADVPHTPTASARRAELAHRLFFSPQITDVIPASDWAMAPPDIEVAPGVRTYGHEYHVLRAIKGFLPESIPWTSRDHDWNADAANSLICIGSGASNRTTRMLVGDKVEPIWDAATPQGPVRLEYGMARFEGQVSRLQYGREIWTDVSAIVGRNRQVVAQPEAVGKRQIEDYLLVTRLPGLSAQTSVVIFGGLGGPGTRATELLFNAINPAELEYLAGEIGLEDGNPCPPFQAVFRARSFMTADGSDIPEELTCVRRICPPVRLG